MKYPLQLGPSLPCPSCGVLFGVEDAITYAYFQGEKPACGKCKQVFDWWDLVLTHIQERTWLHTTLAPVGARSTILKMMLRPKELVQLNLVEHGVPSDARVLQIVYTPQGGSLFPIEFHGNSPPRNIIPHTIMLYPIPLGSEVPVDTEVVVMVCWVPRTGNDYAWQSLITAFEAYAARKYEMMVIPANVAVEWTLNQILSEHLERTAAKDRVKSFLEQGATYGHQLNVLFPSVIQSFSLPPLPDSIRGRLNRLKGLRDDVAHSGFLAPPLRDGEAAECLCGAVFAFHYLNLVRPRLVA